MSYLQKLMNTKANTDLDNRIKASLELAEALKTTPASVGLEEQLEALTADIEDLLLKLETTKDTSAVLRLLKQKRAERLVILEKVENE